MTYEHPSPSESVFNPVMPALDVTDDEAYPTPTGPDDVEKLLARLPGYARVLCAITAAEMVVHLWEESPIVEEELSDYKDWPRESLEALAEYLLDGETKKARPNIITSDMVVDEALIDGQLFAVASAVDDVVWEMKQYEERVAEPGYPFHKAVSSAARAEMIASNSSPSEALQSFYKKWWQRCRARLAFRVDKSVTIN